MTIDDFTICRDASAWTDENDIVAFEVRDRNGFSHIIVMNALCHIRHQLGKFIERAGCLPDRTHFQPMTEKHDVNKRDQFPEETFTEIDELRGDTIDECNGDSK